MRRRWFVQLSDGCRETVCYAKLGVTAVESRGYRVHGRQLLWLVGLSATSVWRQTSTSGAG